MDAEKDIYTQEGRCNRGMQKTTQQGALCFVLLTKYNFGEQLKTVVSRACSTYWGRRGAYRVSDRRPEGRRPLGSPRQKWEHIKMDLREVRWEACTDWINLAQDRDRW